MSKEIGNIKIDFDIHNDLMIMNDKNIIIVPSQYVDDFIQGLIDEAW